MQAEILHAARCPGTKIMLGLTGKAALRENGTLVHVPGDGEPDVNWLDPAWPRGPDAIKPTLSSYMKEAHETAVSKGWWGDDAAEMLAHATDPTRIDVLAAQRVGHGDAAFSAHTAVTGILITGYGPTAEAAQADCRRRALAALMTRSHLAVRNVGEVLALAHSELSEALEEWRNGYPLDHIYTASPDDPKPLGFPIELADLLIRIFDNCVGWGIDIEEALRLKMAFNKGRAYRHGGKRA